MTGFLQPAEHQKFLGASFVNKQNEIVLRVGSRQWTRMQLVQQVGVGNLAAAAKLSTVLRKTKVDSIEKLYAVDPRDFALIPKLGETTVFVAMAVLQAEGFNVDRWIAQITSEKKKVVTFRCLKLQQKRGPRRRR
mgnify:CR=1 FL=1